MELAIEVRLGGRQHRHQSIADHVAYEKESLLALVYSWSCAVGQQLIQLDRGRLG